jgi:hypothetical protein
LIKSAKSPKTIVVDRNISPIESIKSISPNIHIVFCQYHLANNIVTTLHDYTIHRAYLEMVHNKLDEALFLNLLSEKEENPSSTDKQRRFIQKLKTDLSYWIPSVTSSLIEDATTSRVEGFFGRLKDLVGHKQCSLFEIAEALKKLSEMRMYHQLENEPEYLQNLKYVKAGHAISNERIQIDDEFSYSQLMAKLEPYVSAANRNPQICEAFTEFFIKVHSIEAVKIGNSQKIQDPPTIKMAGTPTSKPSLNFPISGARRKHKKYYCSICNQEGHNASKCPKK